MRATCMLAAVLCVLVPARALGQEGEAKPAEPASAEGGAAAAAGAASGEAAADAAGSDDTEEKGVSCSTAPGKGKGCGEAPCEESCCDKSKLELECESGHCSCCDFERAWHHVYGGVLGQVAGAMRGYNQHSLSALLQIGFKGMAFELALSMTEARVQVLPTTPDGEDYQLSAAIDGRAIFYGNSRHRTGFFIGGGSTHVPRDDGRVEWWVRAPFGIDVHLTARADTPAFVLVGRAFVEPWFPVGQLENEVSVMFGVGLGVLIGGRNGTVPFGI